MRHLLFLAVLFLSAPFVHGGGKVDPPRNTETKVAPVKVVIDTTDAPEAAAWAKKAAELVEQWHPKIVALLPSDGFQPATEVKLVFKNMKGVAYASGRTITISAKWIKDNPGDTGMIVHELTHVLQLYPRGGPGWLIEGIADYIRFGHFEPETKIRIDVKKASYKDSYRTTAKFLNWVEKTKDKELVVQLNAALRNGTFKMDLFETRTKMTVDQLWAEFIAAEERARVAPMVEKKKTTSR
jgi:hypothetical protein